MKRAGKLFLRGFMKSSLIILFLLIIGIISYQAVTKLFHIPVKETLVAFRSDSKQRSITEASLDDVSKNLIYCWDEEKGEITKLVLEIFHCGEGKLYYITIPARTQVTLSASLYKKLTLVNPSLPQVMKLSALSSYFPEDTVFHYGVLVLEDVLGLPLSYYTVVPQMLYSTMFISRSMDIDGLTLDDLLMHSAGNNYTSGPIEAFSKEYMTHLHTLTTEEALEAYLTQLYEELTSNLTLSDKFNYVDSYRKLSLKDISFEQIPGVDKNSGFYIEFSSAIGQLSDYTAGSAE